MRFATGAQGTSSEAGRHAWKFLAPGAVAPFAGTRWPTPSAAGPGAWVVGETEDIYACRTEDLSWWVDCELWEVELAGPVEEFPTQLRGRAGRLLAHVAAWDGAALYAYGEACAWRAREWAVEALVSEQLGREAEVLRQCQTLDELTSRARAAEGLSRGRNLAGFLADTAARASQGKAALAACNAASAAILYRGSPEAFEAERRWQAAWIAKRAQLPAPAEGSDAAAAPLRP